MFLIFVKKEHPNGCSPEMLHDYFKNPNLPGFPLMEISKNDIVGIYQHQALTLDGMFVFSLLKLYLFFFVIFKEVLSVCSAASGNSLETLKRENPLLMVQFLPNKYILVDGNHRLCIQWNDVSNSFCSILHL